MTTTTPYTRAEAALARAVERWNVGDLAGYLEVYADDVRLHGFTPEPMDKRAARAFYEGMFAAFPDNRLELHDTFGPGNRLSQHPRLMTSSHQPKRVTLLVSSSFTAATVNSLMPRMMPRWARAVDYGGVDREGGGTAPI
jgi:hypothetical protein